MSIAVDLDARPFRFREWGCIMDKGLGARMSAHVLRSASMCVQTMEAIWWMQEHVCGCCVVHPRDMDALARVAASVGLLEPDITD